MLTDERCHKIDPCDASLGRGFGSQQPSRCVYLSSICAEVVTYRLLQLVRNGHHSIADCMSVGKIMLGRWHVLVARRLSLAELMAGVSSLLVLNGRQCIIPVAPMMSSLRRPSMAAF